MPRTPENAWGALFNFAGSGIIHSEHFPDDTVIRATVTLDDSEIKALGDDVHELIPAPGANKIIVPLLAYAQARFAHGAYTNINADAFMGIVHGTSLASYQEYSAYIGNDSGAALTQLTDFFNANNRNVAIQPIGAYEDASLLSNWSLLPGLVYDSFGYNPVNYPVGLLLDNGGDGALTGGDSLNTLQIDVWYDIITASPIP